MHYEWLTNVIFFLIRFLLENVYPKILNILFFELNN